MIYCGIIINGGVLIFHGFRGSLKPQTLSSNEIQFSHLLISVVFETTNSRTHGYMYFEETMKIGANE